MEAKTQKIKGEDISTSLKPRDIIFRNKMRPVDAMPMIKDVMKIAKSGTTEQRDLFLRSVESSFTNSGEILIKRAIEDGYITAEKYHEWELKYKMAYKDMCCILEAFYSKLIDKSFKKDKLMIVTCKGTPIWKAKSEMKKLFDVTIITAEGALKRMKKEEAKKNGNRHKQSSSRT